MQRGTIGDRTLKVGSSLTIKISDFFSDADDPDSTLVYTIVLDNANSGSQATMSLVGRDLTVNAGDAAGKATIKITVKDTYDATAHTVLHGNGGTLCYPGAGEYDFELHVKSRGYWCWLLGRFCPF